MLTVAWTGITNTVPPKTYISVRPSRYSHGIIKKSGEFAINLTTRDLVRSADWCGVYTGAKVDKFSRCRLTKEPANEIGCPLIAESPLSLECRVTDVISLGSHDMFLAEVVSVQVSDEFLDETGKFHFDKAKPICYSHGAYYGLGKKLGTFGYSVKKKEDTKPVKAAKKPASKKDKSKSSKKKAKKK